MATKEITVGTKVLSVDFNYDGKDYEDNPSECPAYEKVGDDLNYVGTYNEVTGVFTSESSQAANEVDQDEVQQATAHFLDLYADEIKAGEVTEETIYEWWTQTRNQYESADYDEVEASILSRI